MKRLAICFTLLLACSLPASAQNNDVKFIADTLVVQADGTYPGRSGPRHANFRHFLAGQRTQAGLRKCVAGHAKNRRARGEE